LQILTSVTQTEILLWMSTSVLTIWKEI